MTIVVAEKTVPYYQKNNLQEFVDKMWACSLTIKDIIGAEHDEGMPEDIRKLIDSLIANTQYFNQDVFTEILSILKIANLFYDDGSDDILYDILIF